VPGNDVPVGVDRRSGAWFDFAVNTDEIRLLRDIKATQAIILAEIIELRHLHEYAHGPKFKADYLPDAAAMIADRVDAARVQLDQAQ
jgi:hypothetical protein